MRIQHLSRGDQAQYQDESDEADIRSMNALVGSTAHLARPAAAIISEQVGYLEIIVGFGERNQNRDIEDLLLGALEGGLLYLTRAYTRTHAHTHTHTHTHTPQAGLRPKGPCLQPRRRFGRSPEAITATDRYLSLRCFRRYCKQNEYSLIGVPTLGERNEPPSPRPPSSPILLFLPVF